MSDRLQERLGDREVRKDIAVVGDFTRIYCDGTHADRPKARLGSPAVDRGVYGRKVPVVCEECAEMIVYAEKRRAFCPKDPKPFCAYCDTHCYKAEMNDRMNDMMRYAGPRSMFHGHAIDGVKHLIDGMKHKRAAKRAGR